MLIASARHTAEDVAAWRVSELEDAATVDWKSRKLHEMAERAGAAVASFAERSPCYAGVSWGKDSVVLADIVATHAPDVPLVYVRVEHVANPDCDLVRDAFLAAHPRCKYDEITVPLPRDAQGRRVGKGALEAGFALAVERHGDAYISGVRGSESKARSLRMRRHGVSTDRTCAPLGWWTASDVFAWLHMRGLPVHPAYACTLGGRLDRGRIRVSTLGGERGTGHGRREMEWRYYPEEMATLRRLGVVRAA